MNLAKLVRERLESSPGARLSAREVATWIFENHRGECEEKRRRSKQDLGNDNDLIQQLIAEIGALRKTLEARAGGIRTTETRPRLYYFSNVTEEVEVERAESTNVHSGRIVNSERLVERDLYPLLSSYLVNELNVYTKRIDEKTASNRLGINGNKWLFPDVVGLEDLGGEWSQEIRLCVREYGDKRACLWSFEVKRLLNRSNVREAWFQTVSNSSWANFGYLVAAEISTKVIKELRMLSALHGVGVIRLDTANPAESSILIPARERANIDWDTCNRLAEENGDFIAFVELVRQFHQTGNLRSRDWDAKKAEE